MLDVWAWFLALPPAFALTVFTIELVAGLRPLRAFPKRSSPAHVVILVPAHNEEASVGRTIRCLLAALGTSGRVLVVADNCSDATATAAREAGAETIERHDGSKRGKGYALAFGRDYLELDPPDVVLVVDADCFLDQASVSLLVASALLLRAPVQGINLLTAPEEAPPIVKISNFALLIKNLVRARGLYRLAGGITLFGTGMAFPWINFKLAALDTGEVVEDLRLSLDLARGGTRVHLIEGARVLSPAAAADDTISQRRRWEHGFLGTALREAIPLAAKGLITGSRHQLCLGLHLCVPPLALLLSAASICVLVLIGMATVATPWAPALFLLFAMAAALSAILLAWLLEGRSTLPLVALARAPSYIVRKLPIYAGFLKSRQSEWNRTPRDRDDR